MINLWTVDKWINKRKICDQTTIVWQIFDSNHYNYKTYNYFFAWDDQNNKLYKSQFEYNELINGLATSLRQKEKELEMLINQHIENGIFKQTPQIVEKIHTKTTEINICKQEYISKTKIITANIKYYKNYISWFLIDNFEFAKLLIDYKLPVLNVRKNYWWGYFNEKAKNQRQAQFFERFKNLKINPLDNCELIVSDLRITLIHYGDLDGPTSKNFGYNADAFFKKLKQYNYFNNVESTKEKVVRHNTSFFGKSDNHE